MSKPTISDIPYGTQLGLKQRGVEAATFLVKNPAVILGSDGADYLKNTVKISGPQTPFTEIYSRVAESGRLRQFTMFDLSRSKEDIPTVLTLNELTIDGKYISKTMPQAYQNAWINLTPILGRRDAYNSSLQISDQMQFAALISRGILCMSYNDSDEWLTSSLNATMVEAYSLLFAMHLKNRFDLNAEEYAVVRTLFAAYYAQKVCSNNAPKNCPPLLYRCKDIWRDVGSPNAVDDRLASVEEVRNQIAPDGVLSIKVICDILAKAGPQRMQKLISERLLYTYMSRSPTDSRAMYCAIDYPPYFVWLILQNLRNGKNPLFNLLIKFGNMKTILTKFSEDLVTSKLFIDKVAR